MARVVGWLLMSLLGYSALGVTPAADKASAPTPVPMLHIVSLNESSPELRPDFTTIAEVEVKWNGVKPAPATVQFYLRLSRHGTPCKATVTNLLPNIVFTDMQPTQSLPIEITGCSGGDASGYLGISNNPVKDEISVQLSRANPRWLTFALYLSLVLALAVAAYSAVIVTRHGHKLTDAIGGATWDFSSSWASNLTAFGAAFSFLIQATIDKPIFGSRMEYGFLAAFAAALVAVAPMIQRMLGNTQIDASSDGPTATTHGQVGGFLTASVFTMWGAYLQIALAILILTELQKSATIIHLMARPVEVCVLLVGVGLVIYCWSTILTTVAANASRTGAVKGALKTFSAAPVAPAVAMTRKISVL